MTHILARAATAAALIVVGASTASAHTAGDVFDRLQARGYTNIQFTDSIGPNYMANACRDGIRYHFHVNNYGDVTQRRDIGDCGRRAWRDRRDENYRRWGWRGREDNGYERWGWRRLRSSNDRSSY